MNTQQATHLIFQEPISEARIKELVEVYKIDPAVANIDLEMVKMKLRDGKEGENWTQEQCESVEIEYKRFLHLCRKYGKGLTPWGLVDTMWHYHILDTIAYHKDCQNVFGRYIHHYPYFGMRGEEDKQNLLKAGERTAKLYEQEFGENLFERMEDPCWHWCKDECWHACAEE